MSEEQDKQRNTRKKENNRLLTKAAIIGVVAGLLGGGIAYGGLSAANLNSNTSSSSTASSSSSNTGENGSVTTSSSGTTKVNKSTTTSGTMTSAYKKVQNAVVSVLNYKYTSSSSSSSDIYSMFGYGDSDSSDSSSSKKSLTLYSEGSGVIYTTANGKGYIVTNNHVISGAAKVKVILASGKTIAAKVVGKDSTSDLAVLSIDSKYVTQTASFGDSSSLQSAQMVIAIGSPEGSEYASTVTQGIISSPSRTITYNSNQMTVIQTDAAINSGNSGGPLVNSDGQVIGINSMKLASSSSGDSVEGMGFAIPSNEVVTIINQLVKKGKITRPQLGIKVAAIAELNSYYKKQLGISTSLKKGLYVASVTSGSAAASAGIKKGDVITAANGKTVNDVATLHSILYSHNVGDKVKITVNRNGKTMTFTVTLQASN
ncbi:MAG: trypsin-like peptidase domain-containing protein [Lactobacillus delbrueckii]|jgi:serine protease Do|nr:trypsin-like peptidase domain-containing protein [Lactobacillus delbrueckii]MCI1706786.1 trypsin-like peptidase domain-containing protein [Lactobacillus delbrueckii]MCI1789483.1 trypsin-like peptidase domain-containing protein [Lactobacillus delbrueckii]MCI1929691.1 trypsin-like peptidase domain-containing protein [Lactobacillus delbrueckii]MCI1949648.1 trypsin-like peptidase domain-containing protein [Lactobacillus delbrueckii]